MTIPVIRAQVSGLVPTGARSNVIGIEEFTTVSYANQTELVFPTGKSYTPDTNGLFLFVDGKLLPKSRYTETSSIAVTFGFSIIEGLEITVKWFRYNPSEPATNGSIISSTQIPDLLNRVPGTIWLNPQTKEIKMFTGSEFEDIATKKDLDSPEVKNDRLYGGDF